MQLQRLVWFLEPCPQRHPTHKETFHGTASKVVDSTFLCMEKTIAAYHMKNIESANTCETELNIIAVYQHN